MKNKVSPEVETQALKMAKATQKPGQTKEQTKLIAKGIEKGIAEYKKQQGQKLREIDKQRKQKIKQRNAQPADAITELPPANKTVEYLPWYLLVMSWFAFIVYIIL
ncbi:DUF2956 domain-containing protein [Paraglaciecola aquimarina]|uniref:DUF2956 domain-containing protein n=1 Tax=Paraglaciecola aquimarina TaxID=1235557 RepID=A0ABU3SVW2_9ALTE|nr:DUF2956 domain-containing protein [Paraglaciecola aquimarina]MDU0354140.1 DUF2956 domain-containing protein [Paraglaciecola aquimarina]